MANIDLEMGQFQKVTTLENKDYIVVSLDNGTQGQIKVSDLASVVAAAASLTFKDVTGKYTDANDINENSICRYHSTYQPLANVVGNIGAILTIKGYDARYVYQLQFISYGEGMYLFCRGRYENEWKSWIKII